MPNFFETLTMQFLGLKNVERKADPPTKPYEDPIEKDGWGVRQYKKGSSAIANSWVDNWKVDGDGHDDRI